MKKIVLIIVVGLFSTTFCFSQFNVNGLVISGGINYSKYLGEGRGNNYFEVDKPGFQLELTLNNGNGFEWIIYGISHFEAQNIVQNSKVPVTFFSPYYTEFSWYQKERNNPIFMFFGYDLVGMTFPNMEKPDYHHNITFGGGWNLKLNNKLFLQFKLKPYFVLDNSIKQWFGVNAIANLHFRIPKKADKINREDSYNKYE